MPVWLITGCSTGLGRALALAVLSSEGRVVATARNPQSLDELASSFPETCLPLALDVTDRSRIPEVVVAAEERFGRVDVLVNNAGYGYRAAIEEGTEEDVATLFDTNVFGAIAMIKAVLPGMRARRGGTIVNISSVAVRDAQAGSGFYAATKIALVAVTDALVKEVSSLGIRAIVVEPGSFRTDFSGRSLKQVSTPIADYAKTAGLRRIENQLGVDGTQPGDPDKAARAIIEVVSAPNPPLRLALGKDSYARTMSDIQRQTRDADAWKEISLSTDYTA